MADIPSSSIIGEIPVIRRQMWLWVGMGALCVLLAIIWFVLREYFIVPRRGLLRHAPLALALAPFFVVFPLWQWRARRLREALFESRFRLCIHCTYDLSTLAPTGLCPECGRAFDAVRDVALWARAGAPYTEPKPKDFVPWTPAAEEKTR